MEPDTRFVGMLCEELTMKYFQCLEFRVCALFGVSLTPVVANLLYVGWEEFIISKISALQL